MRRALAAAAATALLAAPAGAAAERPWYAPDHAKLQLAGNVGFLSPGVGWGLGRRLDVDLFAGWVPEAVGGTDIFSVTGKVTWAPWSLVAGSWRVRPLTTSVQLTYTFGDQYFVVPPFFFTPTALRSGIGLGAAASRELRGRRVGLYAELVALDVPLGFWIGNPDALGPEDVFSLAIGARLEF